MTSTPHAMQHDDSTGGGIFAAAAFLSNGWHRDVELRWNSAGDLTHVTPDDVSSSVNRT